MVLTWSSLDKYLNVSRLERTSIPTPKVYLITTTEKEKKKSERERERERGRERGREGQRQREKAGWGGRT